MYSDWWPLSVYSICHRLLDKSEHVSYNSTVPFNCCSVLERSYLVEQSMSDFTYIGGHIPLFNLVRVGLLLID